MSDVQNLADRAKELAENLEAQAAEETVPKEPANIIEIDENLQEQAADLI